MPGDDEIKRAQAQLEAARQAHASKPTRIGSGAPVDDALAGALAETPGGFGAILRDLASSDPDVRLSARFAVADDVRRNLHRHKRKSAPTCPVRLPAEGDLLAILAKRHRFRSAEDRGVVKLFVLWRDSVYRVEHTNEATLRALFEAVITFRELKLPDFAAEVLEHLEVEFEVEYVAPDRRAWNLERRAREYETLSPALRTGEKPERIPSTAHPEDDDTALRRRRPVPPPGSKPDDFADDGDTDFP